MSAQSAARSAIIAVGALLLPEVMDGITEASAIRSFCTPSTRSYASTTAPIAQLPTGWYTELPFSRA